TAHLSLSDNVQDTRERLVGLLWSESDEERARASLRQAVHDIKLAFDAAGFTGFRIDKQTLSLVRERRASDVEEGLAAAAQGAVHPRLLNLGPTHEVACRHLMRTRAARGDIGGALKAYKALWDLLDVDYDIEPSQETQGLVVEIKQMPSLGQEPEALTLAPSLPNALRE